MSEIAIRAEGVGKQFVIGEARQRHDTLRDALAASFGRMWQGVQGFGTRRSRDRFWALRDVSFDVVHGEVLGIIGRNGAGKSTLLKILSRITEPTTGEIMIRGRVGSLLEVGTGFHSELTGRENIYLNGAILGMTRAEIDRKFDEIVAFAEIERFIDTPVKHYSSGMYLRLGFSVAAHLEPEILIVDEVLAVGDAAFQKKCLGKMGDVARGGRTVIFVSHNMDAVQRLCTRAALLEKGRMVQVGPVPTVINRYVARQSGGGPPDQWIELDSAARTGSGEARIKALRYRGPGSLGGAPLTDGCLTVELCIAAERPMTVRCLSLMVFDETGHKLVNAEIASAGMSLPLDSGENVVAIDIEQLHLNPGTYVIGCWVARSIEDNVPLDYVESTTTFEVVEEDPEGHAYPWAVGPVACRFTLRSSAPRIAGGDS